MVPSNSTKFKMATVEESKMEGESVGGFIKNTASFHKIYLCLNFWINSDLWNLLYMVDIEKQLISQCKNNRF